MLIEEILFKKKEEIETKKRVHPLDEYLEKLNEVKPKKPPSGFFIIGEYKRKTPLIPDLTDKSIEEVLSAYEKAGIGMVSILTDKNYFWGDLIHLSHARIVSKLPILRKDFIIDEYQIYESKVFGADAVLLIRDILEIDTLEKLNKLAKELGLTTIIETHEKLDFIHLAPDFVGINNRNLLTMKIEKEKALEVIEKIPRSVRFIVESGINSVNEIKHYKTLGADGVLIGEYFLKMLNTSLTQFFKTVEEIYSTCL